MTDYRGVGEVSDHRGDYRGDGLQRCRITEVTTEVTDYRGDGLQR